MVERRGVECKRGGRRGEATKIGGGEQEIQTRRCGQRVLSIHAQVEIHRLSWCTAWNLNPDENDIFREKHGVMGLDVNLLLDSCGCQSRRDVL